MESQKLGSTSLIRFHTFNSFPELSSWLGSSKGWLACLYAESVLGLSGSNWLSGWMGSSLGWLAHGRGDWNHRYLDKRLSWFALIELRE